MLGGERGIAYRTDNRLRHATLLALPDDEPAPAGARRRLPFRDAPALPAANRPRYNSRGRTAPKKQAEPGAHMERDELAQLRLQAMAAAQIYGCEAGLEPSDPPPLDSANAVVGLKVVVVRRSSCGKPLIRERIVCLPREDLSAAVTRIVRDAATELPDS